tara:strand:- start:213 stop:680 length:468 start_codon:yes stop_codon:yes gene_type:complete
MKKLLLLSLLVSLYCTKIRAQEIVSGKLKNSFIEWNIGIAHVSDLNFPFLGTSVMWGSTFINENNLVFEYEAGFALPTLVTAKFGVGKKFKNTIVIMGIRPFPFNLYLQSSFSNNKNGYWIASIELNPLHSDSSFSFFSKGNINFGYRWNIFKKK